MGTTINDTESVSAAFAACEVLFTANPDRITDEGDSGQILHITVADTADALGFSHVRLVRHDTVMGRFYRLYPVDSDLSILTIDPADTFVPEEITRELSAAIVSGKSPS